MFLSCGDVSRGCFNCAEAQTRAKISGMKAGGCHSSAPADGGDSASQLAVGSDLLARKTRPRHGGSQCDNESTAVELLETLRSGVETFWDQTR